MPIAVRISYKCVKKEANSRAEYIMRSYKCRGFRHPLKEADSIDLDTMVREDIVIYIIRPHLLHVFGDTCTEH